MALGSSAPEILLSVGVSQFTCFFCFWYTFQKNKHDLTSWNITIFNRKYIFIHSCFSIVMVVNSGEYGAPTKTNMDPKNDAFQYQIYLVTWLPAHKRLQNRWCFFFFDDFSSGVELELKSGKSLLGRIPCIVGASSDLSQGHLKQHVSNEKNPGWLGYIGHYTTQWYGDYNKPL